MGSLHANQASKHSSAKHMQQPAANHQLDPQDALFDCDTRGHCFVSPLALQTSCVCQHVEATACVSRLTCHLNIAHGDVESISCVKADQTGQHLLGSSINPQLQDTDMTGVRQKQQCRSAASICKISDD